MAKSSPSLGSRSDDDEPGDFECNICFDLAQHPVITLCGHLYCWPCLCRWVRGHSRSHECPVCKALVEEETVIALYGRGKSPTDPRSKMPPGLQIHIESNLISGLMSGFVPIASEGVNNFGEGVSSPPGYYHGYNDTFQDNEGQMNREDRLAAPRDGEKLKKILRVIVFCLAIVFLTM